MHSQGETRTTSGSLSVRFASVVTGWATGVYEMMLKRSSMRAGPVYP